MKIFHQQVPAYFDDFNIREIPPLMWSHIYVLDHADGGRFRVHLTGTAIDSSLRAGLKGHYMDEITHGPQSVNVLAGYSHCIEQNRTLYMCQTVAMENRPKLVVQASAQPLLASEGSDIKHVLGLMFIDYAEPGTVAKNDFVEHGLEF